MASIINIGTLAVRDDTIIKKEYYPYAPYTNTYNSSDEIRIAIQSKDSYLLPCDSYIYFRINASTAGAHNDEDDEIYFVKNYVSFLFSDVRYELNGVEIDRLRNAGLASTMKLYIASRVSQLTGYNSHCNSMGNTSPRSGNVENIRTFDVVLPLSVWFGFCDDYRKLMINSKHELILNRSRDSTNCLFGGNVAAGRARVTLNITKILWKMPHITLADNIKLGLMSYLSKNRKITIQYRSFDMMDYPTLPATRDLIWAVKTVAYLNRPRYVVIGLQTNRNRQITVNAAEFDDCRVTELRLHLNSQIYPYNMNEYSVYDGIYSELYDMYSRIHFSYYNNTEPMNPFEITHAKFQECPLFAFDTSRADESLITSSVDIKIEIKASDNIPAGTSAYCLIVYDNEFTYSPFDGIVERSI